MHLLCQLIEADVLSGNSQAICLSTPIGKEREDELLVLE